MSVDGPVFLEFVSDLDANLTEESSDLSKTAFWPVFWNALKKFHFSQKGD